jgi:hypothetical protein
LQLQQKCFGSTTCHNHVSTAAAALDYAAAALRQRRNGHTAALLPQMQLWDVHVE